ncbi:hypothetical protein H2201_004316 [Coniosporium apollinis]|uniref:Uncharacterized protein n=2 Tax=Coniosporium TaxID=2810619 RepID=A0ABQ9NT89_9PEZI|nr:hypothetical protein H2199_000083 [Cladosporium sp. JES 115]KAJ9665624.1 hypothetical protein H2201_004316 [Coniosporium apollinis]
MPQYDWTQFEAMLTEPEKRRILAIFCFATAPISCDWEKVANATNSASVNSTRTLHSNMIRKLRGIELGAAGGDGGTAAAGTTTPAVTPVTPKMPKTPKKPGKRKAEDEPEGAKPKTAHKTKASKLTPFDRDMISLMGIEENGQAEATEE